MTHEVSVLCNCADIAHCRMERYIADIRLLKAEVDRLTYHTALAWEDPAIRELKQSPKHLATARFLADLVQSAGPPPTGTGIQGRKVGMRDYWEQARVRWNASHPAAPCAYWTTMKARYERLRNRYPQALPPEELGGTDADSEAA